jgi:hypothetical protein
VHGTSSTDHGRACTGQLSTSRVRARRADGGRMSSARRDGLGQTFCSIGPFFSLSLSSPFLWHSCLCSFLAPRRAGDGPSRSYPLHLCSVLLLSTKGGVRQVAGRSTSWETKHYGSLVHCLLALSFVIVIVISPRPSLSFFFCSLSTVTLVFPPPFEPSAVEFWLRVQHSHHRCSRRLAHYRVFLQRLNLA